MVIDNYLDISQHKMNDLFRVFKFIRAYIDKTFIFLKLYWTDNVHRLELNINKMKEKDLNVILKSHSLDRPKWII